jgi:CDP-diacylglycerol---glycerol-3-phosphate 3-phosphatidyltransferase
VIDPKSFYSSVRRAFLPLVDRLVRLGVTPNMLTMAGILLNLGAAALIVMGYLFWAGIVLIVASICDLLDGSVARRSNNVSSFGAFFDSTMDRISEGATLGALAFFYMRIEYTAQVVATLVFLVASFLVSYTRARAEALDLDCRIGIMSRAERLVILITGLILNRWHVLDVVIFAVAALTAFTVGQRVIYVYRTVRAADRQAPPA